MPQIVMSKLKGQKLDKTVQSKSFAFLQKLAADDTSPGLHIEPMQKAADARARTGRVDQYWRAVLFKLDQKNGESIYVYDGTWPHDEAIERARTRVLHFNPINGITEIIEQGMPPAGELLPDYPPVIQKPNKPAESFLATHGYVLTDLTDALGFDALVAQRIFAATSEDELLQMSESLANQWQIDALLGLAVGDTVEKIRESLGFGAGPVEPGVGPEPLAEETEDDRLAKGLQHPAARMQFTFIENDEELQRVIEGGDFGAWRVFLHPEQRKYAEKDFNGAFRMSGGAGTGKTVVLLHRARRLARESTSARIVLTTFTKALSSALERDLERLDPAIPWAKGLGKPGVLVRGIDALAVAVRDTAGAQFGQAAEHVFGTPIEPRGSLVGNDIGWREAIDDADVDLPEPLQSPSFFEGEYLQVILPNRVTSQEAYFKVRRPGRGIALDRRKRVAVWAVVEQYRQSARHMGSLSFSEVSAIASAYLEHSVEGGLADHVLVDEGQDLTPLHWQLLRALAGEHKNDLFIAEDTHQRIYGHPVVLSRYGIKITGRSRRLTLNYRTTQQNLRFALGVLEGADFVDSDGNEENEHGYRSARSGPLPRVVSATSESGQYDNVAEVIKGWLADDEISPETVAVLTRSRNQGLKLKDQLADRGVIAAVAEPGDAGAGHPVVLTMHKAKGMEFSRVLLFNVSEGSIPNTWALKGVAPEELDDAMLRERSLLYVAASRARDELVISWAGKASPLLEQSTAPESQPLGAN
ncbi:DNA helicase UvrD [Cryobacterium sp. Hh7]|uniref:3'-5' exonuclease n=1 Tax=Cryobacterium sp. Hh7 TaxID=1259159 RepID=UPI00106D7C16|nr:3'-5' exonuclease [Cryobacterium sp. Hh7]TFD51093.1 DNA helicase UvrD [Cryobacterium sp. Hh7]